MLEVILALKGLYKTIRGLGKMCMTSLDLPKRAGGQPSGVANGNIASRVIARSYGPDGIRARITTG